MRVSTEIPIMNDSVSCNFRTINYYIFTYFVLSLNLYNFFRHSATTNFVGKFTQSVRRIVQDVKDEGAPSGMTRDEVIETNERLRSLRLRLEESYETAKKALINLMNKYGDSKSQRNIFQRYPMLKLMIKVRKKGVINPPFKQLMISI